MLLQEITAPGSCFTLQGALAYKKAYKKLVSRSSLLPQLQPSRSITCTLTYIC